MTNWAESITIVFNESIISAVLKANSCELVSVVRKDRGRSQKNPEGSKRWSDSLGSIGSFETFEEGFTMSEDPQKSHEIIQEWQRILRDPFETFENPSDYPRFSWNPKVILKDPPESHENLQRTLENPSAGQKIPQNPTKTLQGSLKPLQQVKRFLRILMIPHHPKKIMKDPLESHENPSRIPQKSPSDQKILQNLQ